ncbi:MAG: methyltransferase domain-containing protein [Pseudomonadota bacterium]
MNVGPGRAFPLKREIVAALRATRLLPLAEAVYGVGRVRRAAADNAAYRAEHPSVAFPPPELIQRTYGSASLRSFHWWGERNAAHIAAEIERFKPCPDPHVLEWGCGLGRIGTHLAERYAYTGVDIDHQSIAWCADNLKGRYTVNRSNPPLPFPDNTWDVVFAVSIFTHLSASAHEAWRDEVARILKPGGIFIFTVHGTDQALGLSDSEKATFTDGRLVVRGGVREGSRTFLAYHPEPYVENVLLAPFEQVRGPIPACSQTLYIGRKPKP